MDCETNDCRKEKRGCKGCYYNKKVKLSEHDKDEIRKLIIWKERYKKGEVYIAKENK